MMQTLRDLRFLPLCGLLAIAGCDDVGTDLAFDELTARQQLALSVLADPGSFDIATDLTTVANDVAMTRGNIESGRARGLNADARAAFAEAREAMLAGDHKRALDASSIARRLIARALIATGGVPAAEDLIERLEDILLTMDEEVFDDPDALRAELETIIAEAHALLEAGDSVGAAARAILGEQRARLRRGRNDRRNDIDPARARLEVSLAQTALSLATRLVEARDVPTDVAPSDVSDHQERWLAHAQRLLEKAEQALSNGNFARALHFAHHAQWSALKAVVLPGGVTEEEARAMVELAQTLHEQAVVALGEDPSEVELRILERAADLIEVGLRKLEAGQNRGVAALWRSAVMSSWLI